MQSVNGEGATFISPVGLAFVIVVALLLLALPRRFVTLPLLASACFLSLGQHIVIGGLNFTMMRILLPFGWARLIFKGELRGLQWNTLDKVVLAWITVRTINYALVWGTSSALINRLGYGYDILGYYFMFRCVLREPDDMARAVRYIALFVGPLALLMMNEKFAGHNLFAIVGAPAYSEIRAGVIRCQGPFGHSILAGTFGASVVPLFFGLRSYRQRGLFLTAIAVMGATAIAALSGSSGPMLAFGAGLVGLAFWPLHRKMRLVRWMIVAVLMVLQVVMSQPLWFILARATVFSGSTGWFRGFLIDVTIRHFADWWLIGSNAAATWHNYLMDVTNQYVAEGLGGGIVALVLFVAILVLGFRMVGRVARSEQLPENTRRFAWSLGAALLTHAVSFVSIAYFDQNMVLLYMLLAGIVATTSVVPAVNSESTVAAEAALYPMALNAR